MTSKTSVENFPVRTAIDPAALKLKIHDLFANQWLLLTAGDFKTGRYNTMTIAWGSIGTMWHKPFVQVVVRPQRHTRKFMDEFQSFSVCAFPPDCHSALQLLGSKSGRDGNKIAEAGLTPVAATVVGAPVFAEAELAIECQMMYWQDMDPKGFVGPVGAVNYPAKDFHRIYFGEIVAIGGTAAYA